MQQTTKQWMCFRAIRVAVHKKQYAERHFKNNHKRKLIKCLIHSVRYTCHLLMCKQWKLLVLPSKTFGTSSSKYTRDGNSDTPNSSAIWKSCKNTVITLTHSTFLYSLIKVQIKVKVNIKVKVKYEVKLPLWVPQRLMREWRYSSPHS